MMRVVRPFAVGCAMLAGVFAGAAHGSFPERPVQITVPGAAGSNSDALVRMMVEKLSASFGQPVIVDNRAGGGGSIARDHVARAKPDGHTLLFGSVGTLCGSPNAAGAVYDPLRDFDAVTLAVRAPAALLVHPDLPARTLAEFIAYAKANPGRVAYGTPGEATSHHVITLLLEQLAGISMVHVPYKNGPQAMIDLMGGQIQAAVEFGPVAAPHVRSGRLRALVIAGDQRIPLMPDVPSAAEAGMPAFSLPAWIGIVAPAGTPPELVARLSAGLAAALKQQQVKDAQANVGSEVIASTPQEFAAHLRSECSRWSAIMQRARK